MSTLSTPSPSQDAGDGAARWAVPLADVVISDSDLEAVTDAYRSGWLSLGPRTAAFEEAFAEYAGTRHAVAVSSGTAALHLMYLAAGLGEGDEVVVPSLTFVATVNAIRYTGATAVFADIAGPLEPWLSAGACEAVLSPRTRAIVHMPYGGHPGDLGALVELAERRGVALLIDGAHAVGARWRQSPACSVGLAAAYSFFANKNLAIGEGGMVTTDDDDLARRVRLLRSHGMTALSWDQAHGHAFGYDVVALGFNYRLDEPRAALGRARLQRLDEEIAQRAALDARYRELLGDAVDCPLAPGPGLQPAHHLFTIVLPEGVDRDAFRRSLARQGVQSSVHYPPAHGMAVHRGRHAELPATEDYARRTVTLPLFAHMTLAQQDRVVAATLAALGER